MKKTLTVLLVALIAVTAVFANASKETKTETTVKGYKEHIVVGMGSSISGCDPLGTNNSEIDILIRLTHNRLVNLDLETQEILPELAKSWTWVNNQVIEFDLRDDVYFQNGEHFTAADVVYTFTTAMGATGFTCATRTSTLEKVEALGDYKVRFTLKSPNADLLSILSLECLSIVNKKAIEADPVEGCAVGTGAWKMTKFAANDYVELVRNDNYWGELPKTKELTLRYIPEPAARLIALENGEIDVCLAPNADDISYIESAKGLDLVQFPTTTCVYLAFDSSEAPGDDQNLRLALAYAINKQEIIDVVEGGIGTVAISNWNPAVYGYSDSFGDYGQDLAKAKEYLAKAKSKEITISTATAARVAALTVIQEQCRQIGLTVNINEVEGAALTAMSKYAKHEHEAMVYAKGWAVFGDDARTVYYKDSNVNKAAIYNERMMELIDNALAETNETNRKAMYAEVQKINHEQAYYVPLYYSVASVGVTKGLSGVIWKATKSYDFNYINLPLN